MTSQQQAALNRANQHRRAERLMKEALQAAPTPASCRDAARLFEQDPHPHLRHVRLDRLLCAVSSVGHVKAGQMLRRAGVSPLMRLGRLTSRQRLALATELHTIASRTEQVQRA